MTALTTSGLIARRTTTRVIDPEILTQATRIEPRRKAKLTVVPPPIFDDVPDLNDGAPEPVAAPRALEPRSDDDLFFAEAEQRSTRKRWLVRIAAAAVGLGVVFAVVSRGGTAPEVSPPVAVPPPVVHAPAPATPAATPGATVAGYGLARVSVPSNAPQLAPPAPEPVAEVAPPVVRSAAPSAPRAPRVAVEPTGRNGKKPSLSDVTQIYAAPRAVVPNMELVDKGRADPAAAQFRDVPSQDEDGPALARPSVLLWTVPGAAAVAINGRHMGKTPLNVTVDPNRTTSIELQLAGYRPRIVTLSPDTGSGVLRVELQKIAVEETEEVDEEPAPEPKPAPPKTPARTTPKFEVPKFTAPPERAMPEPTLR